MSFELLVNQVIIMFNIFKKAKTFTNYIDLHKAVESKMSKLVAGEALSTLRITSMQDIVNNVIIFNCYSDITLARAVAQMRRANRIMTKATATLIKNHQNGQKINFEDKSIYALISDAKNVVKEYEIEVSDRDNLMRTITEEAKTLMSLERGMLLELTKYAQEANQPVMVRS